MTLNPFQRLVLILGLFCTIILGLVAKAEVQKTQSHPIVLATRPVDPRSLFQGDYVVLNYDISNLEAGLFDKNPIIAPAGTHVFVVLRQQEGSEIWQPVHASFNKPILEAGQQMIKGRVIYTTSTAPVRVSYGLEQYFVPEGEGAWIENLRWRLPSDKPQPITVRVLVDAEGNALIDALLLEGKPLFAH